MTKPQSQPVDNDSAVMTADDVEAKSFIQVSDKKQSETSHSQQDPISDDELPKEDMQLAKAIIRELNCVAVSRAEAKATPNVTSSKSKKRPWEIFQRGNADAIDIAVNTAARKRKIDLYGVPYQTGK